MVAVAANFFYLTDYSLGACEAAFVAKLDEDKQIFNENDAKIGAQGKELQSNVTDNESARPSFYTDIKPIL